VSLTAYKNYEDVSKISLGDFETFSQKKITAVGEPLAWKCVKPFCDTGFPRLLGNPGIVFVKSPAHGNLCARSDVLEFARQ